MSLLHKTMGVFEFTYCIGFYMGCHVKCTTDCILHTIKYILFTQYAKISSIQLQSFRGSDACLLGESLLRDETMVSPKALPAQCLCVDTIKYILFTQNAKISSIQLQSFRGVTSAQCLPSACVWLHTEMVSLEKTIDQEFIVIITLIKYKKKIMVVRLPYLIFIYCKPYSILLTVNLLTYTEVNTSVQSSVSQTVCRDTLVCHLTVSGVS